MLVRLDVVAIDCYGKSCLNGLKFSDDVAMAVHDVFDREGGTIV